LWKIKKSCVCICLNNNVYKYVMSLSWRMFHCCCSKYT
jgi:hypothetical protein